MSEKTKEIPTPAFVAPTPTAPKPGTVKAFLKPAKPGKKVEVAPEHRGTKTYQIPEGERFYSNQDQRFYEPGETITVTDFKPGQNWLVEA